MRARLYLRSAAVLTLLLGVGHLLGRPWVPANDLGAKVVVVAMKSHSMQVMGFDRTMMDFYGGFGLIVGVNLLAEAVLLWLVAELVSSDATRARRIAAVFLVMNAAVTALAAAYLFTAPLVLSAAVTLCLGAAVLAPVRPTAS
jgi:hypothetical protein